MSITVEGLPELRAKLKAFSRVAKKSGEKELKNLAQKTVDGIQERIRIAPRIDLGNLVEGIHYTKKDTGDGLEITVKPSEITDRYAIFVERDTRPHWPPRSALEGWADRHGIPVFLVQRSIATKGTKGIHMFEEQYQELLKDAQDAANAIGRDIVIQLKWGR